MSSACAIASSNEVSTVHALSSATSNQLELNKNLKGALCYIQADDQVVFVDEVISKKLSLPGGTIEQGEDPAKTAEREVWEETGLVVHAKDVLTQTETAVVFHCEPASGVIAFAATNQQGFHVLPAWFAPDFAIEIKQVLLGYPEIIDKAQYRYPDQFAQQVLGHKVVNAPIQYIQSAEAAAPAVHRSELPIIESMQYYLTSNNHNDSNVMHYALSAFNILSSLFGVLFLLPILLYFMGGNALNRMIFLGVMTATICLLIQLGLQYPRPYIYLPSLQMTDAIGFSTPSIRSALAVVLIGYFYRVWKQQEDRSIKGALLFFIALMLFQGMASVVLGEQFISDVLFGYVIGLFGLWHFIRMEGTLVRRKLDIFDYPALWLVMALVSAVLTLIFSSIQMANITAVSLAMAGVHSVLRSSKIEQRSHMFIKLLICWTIGAVLIEGEMEWFSHFTGVSSSLNYFMQSGLWFVLSYIIIRISCIEFKTKEKTK
ncbi:bifunctional NUDIX hydrolase/phosphatase PAP2 family protein [Vibrio gangliei]|uniref:bifunctional NUDIX hydrolase/phosphatase PAP2 family protein n=1 Tax=Vibrio gangliei TaxID=2077090 RepID=UPI0014732A9F|nr:NUDIX domain-containing protein [Vibrio gangliei]